MSVDRKEVDWEAVEQQTADCLRAVFGGPETGVVEEILFLLEHGDLAEAYGWPEIIRCEREFPVPRGRVDMMLFHADGSGTVVECKAANTARDLLPGIGQLMAYGVQVGYSRTLTKVRLALASRAPLSELRAIKPVLKACGIEPIFCGRFSQWSRGFVKDSQITSLADLI
jgi:hypothetical protein